MAVTALAHVAQHFLWPYIPPSPHLLFYPAVFVAARLGGTGPGALATALSMAAIAYAFLPPRESITVDLPRDMLNLAVFVAVSLGISVAMGRVRANLQRERAAAREAQLAKAATDATWSMIAHDLRTPLSTIALGSDALARRLHDHSADLERTARAIHRASEGARDLVRDALDAMRSADGALRVEPGPCDVREMLNHARDAVAMLAASHGIRVEVDVATRRPAMCDEPRIIQVLCNLLVNSIRFTPPRGRIALYAEDERHGVRVSVSDTGKGIPEAELGTIFSRYWTGGGGSGLGLWIAKSIVEAHGATLDVKSEVGRGTTFAFVLPAASDSGAAEVAPARAPEHD